jgi:hypothetical protein
MDASVRCQAHERAKPERLCRYITLPAIANERVKLNAKGPVELKLKTPWRDGTTHHVMSTMEFMQRLAALVPRPRLHLTRFHSVLALNAKWRSQVVPQPVGTKGSIQLRPGALPALWRRDENHRCHTESLGLGLESAADCVSIGTNGVAKP